MVAGYGITGPLIAGCGIVLKLTAECGMKRKITRYRRYPGNVDSY